MLKRFALSFVMFSLAVGSAATYKVTLHQAAVVKGTALKAGEYKLDVTGDKAVLMNGKTPIELDAKVEQGTQRFASTAIRYSAEGGKTAITEIRIGGTKTKLVLNP